MKTSRRLFFAQAGQLFGALGLATAVPRKANACLVGKWWVRCPNGHVDMVEDVTCNHSCEACGAQAFAEGVGWIVCPKGHALHVSTGGRNQRDQWMQSYKCPQDGLECRLDAGGTSGPRHREPPDGKR